MEFVDLLSSVITLFIWSIASALLWPVIKGVPEEISWGIRLSLGVAFLFVVGWLDFVLGWKWQTSYILYPFSVIILSFRIREIKTIIVSRVMRPIFISYFLLLGILVTHMSVQVLYYGGGWAVDWIEHYHRASFLVGSRDFSVKFAGYAMTARPPLVNVLAAQILSIFGLKFFIYQVVMVIYGSMIFFPLAGLVSYFKKGKETGSSFFLLALFLAGSPMFVQNILFPWTKMVCTFFILSGLLVFLEYLSTNSWRWTALAYILMGFAFIAHYSAGPYIVGMVCAHAIIQRKHFFDSATLREFVLGGLAGGAVVFIWWAWAFSVYGIEGTFLTNTTVTDSAGQSFTGYLTKVGYNLWATLVPYSWRSIPSWVKDICLAPNGWLALRDQFFNLFQVNIFWAIGPGFCALWLYVMSEKFVGVKRHFQDCRQQFWFVYVTIAFLLGVAAHGAIDHMGLAHICLQPLVYLTIAYCSASFFEQRYFWKFGVIVLWVIGWLLGVMLNVIAQGYINPSNPDSFFYLPLDAAPFNFLNNLRTKNSFHSVMVGDIWPYPLWVYLSVSILLMLATSFMLFHYGEKAARQEMGLNRNAGDVVDVSDTKDV